MGIAREQLIAEWRERLAAAECAPAEGAARPAWLVRVRLRMYRFLLSLYGEGIWNAGQPTLTPAAADMLDLATAVDAREVSLDGKPAKDEAEIRGVLATLAGAQGYAPQPGPLVAGLPADSWVLVGACRGEANAADWANVLKRQGVSARIRRYGHDELIEVPAGQRKEAFAIVDALAAQHFQPRVAENPHTASLKFVVVMMVVLLVALISTGLVLYLAGRVGQESNSGELARMQWELIWDGLTYTDLQRLLIGAIALVVQVGLLIWVRSRRMARFSRPTKGQAAAAP